LWQRGADLIGDAAVLILPSNYQGTGFATEVATALSYAPWNHGFQEAGDFDELGLMKHWRNTHL
jgi:hypothetical protein